MHTIFVISTILLFLGILEKRNHVRRLGRIPIRIHVNGTRGKSLLTRMLAESFDEGGRRTAAKVTGEEPVVFQSSMGWKSWQRRGLPRIREQIRFLKESARSGAEVAIVENMAVSPEILNISENEIVRSGLSLFTNFRTDHQESWGASKEDAIAALGNALPRSGRLMLPESESSACFLEAAHNRENEVIQTEAVRLHESQLPAFDGIVGLARAAGDVFHLPEGSMAVALEGDSFLIPLPGGRHLVNLFSCNEVTSSRMIVKELEERSKVRSPYGVVLACRADRPLRSLSFLEWIVDSVDWNRLIIAGCCPRIPVEKLLMKSDRPRKAVRFFTKIDDGRIRDVMREWNGDALGLGNFVNAGERILSRFLGECDGD